MNSWNQIKSLCYDIKLLVNELEDQLYEISRIDSPQKKQKDLFQDCRPDSQIQRDTES